MQVSCDVINAKQNKDQANMDGIRTMSNNDIQAGMFVSFESHRRSDPVPQAKKQTARCLVFFSTFSWMSSAFLDTLRKHELDQVKTCVQCIRVTRKLTSDI